MAQRVKISSYLKNVGKSLGYAVGDVVSDYMPTARNIAHDTKSTYQDIKYSIQTMKNDNISSATKDFMSDKNILTNTLDDLKSGKWYNKEREEQAFNEMFGGDLDLDFDFDEDWGDDEETSSSAKSIIDQNESSTREIIGSMGQVGSDISKSVAYSNARSAEYIVTNSNAANKALYDLNKQGFNQVTSVLLNMNNTLAGFAELGNGLAAHMQNSTLFFTQTTETLNKMNENLSILVERTKYMDSRYSQDSRRKRGGVGAFAAGGDFSLSDYIETVKENTKEQTAMITGLAEMLGLSMGKNGKNVSLSQFATKSIIGKLIPEVTKEAMKSLNETINDALINGLTRAGRASRKSDNPIVNLLGSLLFPQDNMNAKFNTGSYNKGPMPWDGVARKALVEVIPTYLANIEKALTGKKEAQVYDYNTGKYVTKSDIKRSRDLEIEANVRSSGGDFRKAALSKTTNKEVQAAIEEYFMQAFLNGGDVRNIKGYKLSKNSSTNKEAIEVLLQLLSTPEGRKMASQFESRNTRNRASYDDRMRDYEASGMSMYGHLFNDFEEGGYSTGGRPTPGKGRRTVKSGGKNYKDTVEYRRAKAELGDSLDLTEDEFYEYINSSDKSGYLQKKVLENAKDSVTGNVKDFVGNIGSGKGSKIKNFLSTVKYYWEKPFAVINTALNSLSAGINQLFWGEDGKSGLLDTLKKKLNDFWNNVKEKLGLKLSETGLVDDMKNEWSALKTNTKARAKRIFSGGEAATGSGLIIAGGDSGLKGVGGQIKDGASLLYHGITNFFGQVLDPKEAEKEKKKVFKSIGDTLSEMNQNKGAMGIGAIGGVGVSLLTGAVVGPLAGAAIGASIGLATKSQKFQDFLFGAGDPDSDEYEQGLLKGFGEAIKRTGGENVKTIGTGGAIGLLGGTLMGSPILGAIVGSAAGYITTSENARKYLFGGIGEDGEFEEGVIPKDLQDRMKKNSPWMTAGAIAGLVAGPFGLVGNLTVGAGLGLVASSEEFHNFMFGDPNNKDDKGLAGKIHDKIVSPLDEIMHNIGNAMAGLMRRVGATTNAILKNASEKLNGWLKKASENPNSPIGRLIGAGAKAGKALLTAPVNLLGGALNIADTALKRSNLRTGSNIYDKSLGRNMTAAERLEAARIMATGQISQDEEGNYYRTDINGTKKKISAFRGKMLQAQSDRGRSKSYGFMQADQAISQLSEEEINALLKDDQKLAEFAKSNGLKGAAKTAQLKSLLKNERSINKSKTPEERSADASKSLIQNTDSIKAHLTDIVDILREKFKIKGKGAKSKEKINTPDMLGGMHTYEENDQGELVEVVNDKETDASKKKIEEMTTNIGKIGGIATLLGGIRGIFGKIKDGLFGSKDGESEGLLGMLAGGIGGLFSFFTGEKLELGKFGSKVLGKFAGKFAGGGALSTIFSTLIAPALLVGGFTGAFDGLASTIGNLSIFKGNDTSTAFGNNTSVGATLEDGSTANLKTDENGNFVKDQNGNYITNDGQSVSIDQVKSYDHRGSNTSLSAQLKKNLVTGTVMGKGSVTSAVAKNAVKGASKVAPGIISGIMSSVAKILETFPKILSKIPFLPASVANNADTICTAIYTHLDDAIQGMAKGGANVAKKLGGLASKVSKIMPLLQIAYVIGKGIDAWGNAESILGITEDATTPQRIIAVLIAVANAAIPIVGDLIPNKTLVNIFMDIAPKLGIDVSDLAAQREAANAEVEAYNAENGTDLSIEEYNQMNGKAGVFTKAKNKIKGFGTSIKEKGFKATVAEAANSFGGEMKQNWDISKTLLAHMKNGDLKALWSEKFEDLDADENPVNFAQKLGATWMKLQLTIPTALFAVGHKIADGVKGVINKVKSGIDTIRTERDKGAEIWTSGTTFREMFNFDDYNDDEGNPIGGFTKAILFQQRLMGIPIAILRSFGEKLKEKFTEVKDKVVGGAQNIASNLKAIDETAISGKVKDLLNYKAEETSEDNPIGGFQNAMITVYKFGRLPLAGLSWVGHKISDGFKSFIAPIKTDASSFSSAVVAMNKASDDGDIEGVFSQSFTPSEDNKLGGLFNFGYGLMKFVNVINAFANKFGQGIKDLFGNVADWVGEKVGAVKEWAGEKKEQAVNWVSDKVDAIRGVSASGSGFVSQFDPAYQGYSISGSSFAGKGCGPAVAAMTASALGRNLSVGSAVNKAAGYQVDNGVTLDYFQNALGSQGISTQVIAGGSSADLYSSIAHGKKVILLGQDRTNTSKAYSPFGPNNHYVLATGLDRSGNVIVNDPEANGPRVYSPSILNSAKYGVVAGRGSGIRRKMAIPRSIRYLFAGGGGVRNDATTQQIWAFLTSRLGMSAAAAAGVMGNMQQESGCEPDRHQTGGPAYGICQWEGGRKTKLMSRSNYQSLDVQLNYLAEELPSQYWKKSGTINDKDGKNYSYSSMTYDQFKQMQDVAQACIKFEAAFERAGKPMMANRINYATQYYNMFSGSTYTYTGSGEATTSSSSSSASTEKPLFSNILNVVSDVGTLFSKAFGFLSGNSASEESSGTTTSADGSVASYNYSGSDPLSYMRSVFGKLKYSMSGARNPEKGSADCSSTVRWAVQKATGVDIGGSTPEQYDNANLRDVWYQNGAYASSAPDGLQPNDILFFSRPTSSYTAGRKDRVGHVGIYEGNGKYLHHGGGADGKLLGPTEATISSKDKLVRVRRLAAAGSGLVSYNDLANIAGGSSGMLLASRAGSRGGSVSVLDTRTGRLVPISRFAGGASNITDATRNMLSNISNTASASAKSGTVSAELVAKLLESITNVLNNIADNTAPINKIYNALVAYLEAGGSSGTSGDTTVIKKKDEIAEANKSGIDDIDSNISTLVGVLAELAKG